jgi:hypothetical protein
MRILAALFSLLPTSAALAQGRGIARVLGCYSVTWSDSLNSSRNQRYHNLPPAFRLEAQRDTSVSAPVVIPLRVTLLGTPPDSLPEPPRAWWTLVGRDSVSISMVGWPPIHWDLLLVAHGDSLIGRVSGYLGDGAVGPYPVFATRIACR